MLHLPIIQQAFVAGDQQQVIPHCKQVPQVLIAGVWRGGCGDGLQDDGVLGQMGAHDRSG